MSEFEMKFRVVSAYRYPANYEKETNVQIKNIADFAKKIFNIAYDAGMTKEMSDEYAMKQADHIINTKLGLKTEK